MNRINNINWNNFGKLGDRLDSDLVYEYLRRAAKFYKENSVKPVAPFYFDVVWSLGYKFGKELPEMDLSEFFEEKTVRNLSKGGVMVKNIIKGYLKLSEFIDEKNFLIKYLEVYDPLIRILERGGNYQYKEGGIMVQNSGLFPLHGWYEKFLEKEPIDINDMI